MNTTSSIVGRLLIESLALTASLPSAEDLDTTPPHSSEMFSTTLSPLVPSPLPILNASLRPQSPLFDYMRNLYIWLVPSMIIILTVITLFQVEVFSQIAILGNGLIVVSSPWLSRPVSPYLKLCISLAAADLWAASLLITGLVVNSYIPVVIEGRPPVSKCPEAALELFRVSGMLTSDLHLFALAVNQFVGIAWPLKYKMIVTSRRMLFLILWLWVAPLFFTFVWFVSFPNDGLRHPKCHFNFYQRFPFRLTIFLIFMIPLIATLLLYVFILAHLFKAKARFDAQPPTVSNGYSLRRSDDFRRSTVSTSRKNQVQGKLKLVWTTLLIVSTFSFSWGLCVFLFVIVCVDGCLVNPKAVGIYRMVAMGSSVNCLVMVKLALNPFIYTLRIRHIRASVQGFAYWLCRRRLKRPSPQATLTDYHAISVAQTTVADSEGDDWLRRVVSLNPLRRHRASTQALCYSARSRKSHELAMDLADQNVRFSCTDSLTRSNPHHIIQHPYASYTQNPNPYKTTPQLRYLVHTVSSPATHTSERRAEEIKLLESHLN